MTIPNDIARCAGFGPTHDDWLEECQDCQRRTALGGEVHMEPPTIIAFWCEYCIPPDRPEDQRLRELASQLEVAA